MDDSELHDTLEKLHQELEQTDGLDDESRQRLQHLMGDIRTALDREEASPSRALPIACRPAHRCHLAV